MTIVVTFKPRPVQTTPSPSASSATSVVPPQRRYGSRAQLSENFWGKLIRQLRLEQKVSQRELCRKCNIQSRTLRKYEEGKSTPYIDIIERILEALAYELEALNRDSIKERYRREHAIVSPEKTPANEGVV